MTTMIEIQNDADLVTRVEIRFDPGLPQEKVVEFLDQLRLKVEAAGGSLSLIDREGVNKPPQGGR